MLERQHAKESTMDTQGSSVVEPLAEVRIDVSSEGMAIEKAFQDSGKPTSFEDYKRITNQSKAKEVPIEASSEGPRIDEASQDGGRPTLFEVYLRIANQSKASQDSGGPLEVMPMPVVNKKSEDLFVAAQKGDWKTIEDILKKDPEAMTAEVLKVEHESVTVLNIAIMASQDQLVENLIKHFPPAYKNFDFSISLQNAAMRGRIKMVEALVNKVDALLESVPDALWIATKYAPKQKDVIWYLAERTKSSPINDTMPNLIMAGHLAPKWLKLSLQNLVTKPGAALLINRIELRHKCSLEFAELVLTKMKNDMNDMETPEIPKLLPRIVLEAASRGISEIVKLCFEYFPELTWNENFTKKLIEKVVNGRHVELFRLVNSASTIPFLTADTMTKGILMKAVVEWPPRCLPTDVSGAPFLMQRELQWFKVLEDKGILTKAEAERPPRRLPTDASGAPFLMQSELRWPKPRLDSHHYSSFCCNFYCTGRQQRRNRGPEPELEPEPVPEFDVSRGPEPSVLEDSFMVFAVADALALFSSVTATLMFLAILTSRYAAEDFLMSLPRKMILGLTFLFLSLAFMLVAFGSALTIVLNKRFLETERLMWIYSPITLFAAIPVVLSIILLLPLYFEMVGSTYWPRLYRPLKLWE
ncbi:hypothetical protein NL676_010868 [Syzygium grande]|nr:hypothetical protein NL676_010868 [Syzygium grande]